MDDSVFFLHQLKRETRLIFRQSKQLINAVMFFLMIMIFFPLTMPADIELLRKFAPGLVWIAILLSMLLSAERLFQQDYEDGVIEQWLLSGYPLYGFIFAKTVVHWVFILFSILLLSPLLMVLFNFNRFEMISLLLSLICGTPALFFLCALAAVFGAGVKQKGVFMALIVLPLTIPVMIFGSSTLTAAMSGFEVQGYLALLLAMSILTLFFLPFAIAAMIKVGMVE